MGHTLDTRLHGSGPLVAYIAEEFKPDVFYVETIRRNAWWVIDFESEAKRVQFTPLAIWKAGNYPTLIPIMTAWQTAERIPGAAGKAQTAPGV
jgi:hypothetical protein